MRALLLLPLALASCELLDIEIPEPRNCSSAGSNADVSGQWVIRGVGERTSCDESLWDGSFELGPSASLAVQSTPGADTDALSLERPIEGFSLTGTVEGSCVTFETTESYEGGTIRYTFSGGASGSTISGELESENPAGCRVTGTFEVEID